MSHYYQNIDFLLQRKNSIPYTSLISNLMDCMDYLLRFWLFHPALLYGLSFVLGITARLAYSLWPLIPIGFLWIPFAYLAFKEHPFRKECFKPLILSVMTFLTAFVYAAAQYSLPVIPTSGLVGTANVKIKSISLQPGIFGKRWIYRCEIEQFYVQDALLPVASSLQCIIILPGKEIDRGKRPKGNQNYWVSGTLLQKKGSSNLLKVSARTKWEPIQNTWSWAEDRYAWKRQVTKWIESRFSHSSSASFLAGLATGEFDDQWMRQHFARFGLQHLLAISGFHFAIIAAFLNFALGIVLPRRIRLVALLIVLSGYCFFLGPQGSIMRAWIMCSIAFLGGLIERQSTALNSVGLALIVILAFYPLLCLEIGFQLSFAATAAILIYYPAAQSWLNFLFPKRKLGEVLQMNGWDQHGYCVLSFFREGVALTIAVNVFAFPLTLFYFQQFPLMSLAYNLFFPFLASLSMCLLLIGGLFFFIPWLGNAIHAINDSFTYFILQLTYQAPAEMDSYVTTKSIPTSWIVLYVCVAAVIGIIWKEKNREEGEEEWNFV